MKTAQGAIIGLVAVIIAFLLIYSQPGHPVKAAIETALAQHLGNIAVFLQMRSGFLDIPTKVQRSHNGA